MFEPQFHIRLKQRRLQRGITQREAASLCGISKGRWSDLEQGRRMPSDWEFRVIDRNFHLGQVFVAPKKATQKLLNDGARLSPIPPPLLLDHDRTTYIRYRSSVARHIDLTEKLTHRVRYRPDFQWCQHFCHQVRCDSYLESLYILCRLAEGAVPSLIPPARFSRTPLPIVDPASRIPAEARPHLCLSQETDYEFFQVSFLGRKVHRVDILTWVGHWRVVELDGEGHASRFDSEREQDIALPTLRLCEKDVLELGQGICRVAA